MTRFQQCFLATFAAFALTASLGVADTQRKSDPKGDTKGQPRGAAFDLRSATAGHTAASGGVTHRATSWTSTGRTFVALMLDTDPRSNQPNWAVVNRTSKKACVVNVQNPATCVASATLKVHSSKSFSFSFNMKFAGNPPSYRWRWRVFGKGNDQNYDWLPDAGMVKHRVAYGGDQH